MKDTGSPPCCFTQILINTLLAGRYGNQMCQSGLDQFAPHPRQTRIEPYKLLILQITLLQQQGYLMGNIMYLRDSRKFQSFTQVAAVVGYGI